MVLTSWRSATPCKGLCKGTLVMILHMQIYPAPSGITKIPSQSEKQGASVAAFKHSLSHHVSHM